jgi:hypothetical protein
VRYADAAGLRHPSKRGDKNVSEVTTAEPTRPESGQSPIIITLLPLFILFAAAAALFWLTTQDLTGADRYWEVFLPVVAVLALFSGWGPSQMAGNSQLGYLIRQVVHWGTFVGLVYLFNLVGFRELLSDQQYMVVLVAMLAGATLIAAFQMDFKLVVFALFLAFCAYVLLVPSDNPALARVGEIFHIADAQSRPAVVGAVLAVIGFGASLIIHYMRPWSAGRRNKAAPAETPASAN